MVAVNSAASFSFTGTARSSLKARISSVTELIAAPFGSPGRGVLPARDGDLVAAVVRRATASAWRRWRGVAVGGLCVPRPHSSKGSNGRLTRPPVGALLSFVVCVGEGLAAVRCRAAGVVERGVPPRGGPRRHRGGRLLREEVDGDVDAVGVVVRRSRCRGRPRRLRCRRRRPRCRRRPGSRAGRRGGRSCRCTARARRDGRARCRRTARGRDASRRRRRRRGRW